MEIKCEFDMCTSRDVQYYRCSVTNQQISENCELKFIGQHQEEKTNEDVTYVSFNSCTATKVPQGITKIFPNLKVLHIYNSNLKNISKNDLVEFKNLKMCWCTNNKIEFLPRGLFEGFENLESITFHRNNLKVISPNILDGLEKLKLVNLKGNPGYVRFYSTYPGDNSTSSLEEIKADFIANFERNSALYAEYLKQKNPQSTYNPQLSFLKDLKSFIQDDTFKDFSIQIEDQEFRVHKFLLAARSPTLAEILKNNPEVENLNLVDISVEIFEIILKFIYTDELPGEFEVNLMELFATAGKLKINELKEFATVKIIGQIDENNALNILKLSNKYDHDEMRFRAFAVLMKKYPNYNLKFEFADDIDKIDKFTDAFKRKEEVDREIEEIFKD
jgi:Leucine-rich repeat (LRR) protein